MASYERLAKLFATEPNAVDVPRRREDPVEQAPSAKRGHSGRVHQVGRDRIAGERRLVDDEDLVTLSGEEHGQRIRRDGLALHVG